LIVERRLGAALLTMQPLSTINSGLSALLLALFFGPAASAAPPDAVSDIELSEVKTAFDAMVTENSGVARETRRLRSFRDSLAKESRADDERGRGVSPTGG
jgi:hypothetical protein